MLKAIVDILFPKYCLVCGKPGFSICSYCKKKLIPSIPECYICRRISSRYKTHSNCMQNMSLDFLFYAWRYTDISSRLIKVLKYKGAFNIQNEIGELLQSRLLQTKFLENFKNPLLVPIPLHKKRLKERGFNQTELICKEISKLLNVPYTTSLLKRNLYSTPQAKKDVKEREALDEKTFCFDNDLYLENYPNKEIILIDDVVTTGTTLDVACRTIKRSNKDIKVSAICLFRGNPDYSSSPSA
jgi:ComF family protein